MIMIIMMIIITIYHHHNHLYALFPLSKSMKRVGGWGRAVRQTRPRPTGPPPRPAGPPPGALFFFAASMAEAHHPVART
jgi:hypothetical protein